MTEQDYRSDSKLYQKRDFLFALFVASMVMVNTLGTKIMEVFRKEKGTHFEPCIAIAVLNLEADIKRYVERESIKLMNMSGGETEELS